MADLYSRLQQGIPRIVARWQELTDRPPWNLLSTGEWIDHLPPLLAELLSQQQDWTSRELIQQAVKHGSHRREQLFAPDAILDEYHVLRAAIWEAMTTDAAASTMLGPIMVVDNRISIANLASIHALYRAEWADEPWQALVQELEESWESAAKA